MSEYTTRSTTLTLRDRAAAAAQQLLVENCGALSSARLGALATHDTTAAPLAGLEERWRRLEALAGADGALRQTGTGAYREASHQRDAALAAARAGDPLQADAHARDAHRSLGAALTQTTAALRADERQIAAAVAERALGELGYRVRRADGAHGAGLWAERDHHVIAALVTDGGAMEIDNAGVTDGGCQAPMLELQQAMARHGAQTEIARRLDHGDDRGGQLIRRAVRANPAHPERGLVAHLDQTPGPAAQPVHAVRNIRPIIIGGES